MQNTNEIEEEELLSIENHWEREGGSVAQTLTKEMPNGIACDVYVCVYWLAKYFFFGA